MRIGKYLLGTKDRGVQFIPNKSRGIECFVDADFAGSWDKTDAGNPENLLSRTGYVIFILVVLLYMHQNCKPKLNCPQLKQNT